MAWGGRESGGPREEELDTGRPGLQGSRATHAVMAERRDILWLAAIKNRNTRKRIYDEAVEDGGQVDDVWGVSRVEYGEKICRFNSVIITSEDEAQERFYLQP